MRRVILSLLCALVLCAGCAEKKPVLRFYTWADYIDESLVREFEQANNCEVHISYYESNESMLAKLRTSNVQYDVLLPSTYAVEMLREEGLIQPLNHELIPNARKYVNPRIAAKVGDPQLEYSVPYYQGFTGIGYNSAKMVPPPDSWHIYENPEYARRMSLLDDMRATIGVALLTLGYDGNSVDDAELAEAKELVLKWKANIAKFGVDDVKQELRSDALYAIQGYAGDIFQISRDFPDVRFVVPKEGGILTYDHLVIPANAGNYELACKFVNMMCDPDNALKNIIETRYVVPIPEAIAKMPDDLKQIPSLLPTDEEIDKSCIHRDLGKDTEKYTKIWNEIRAN